MNKYIIFTGTITRMGGAQMYVNNKAKYMRKSGWETFVFSGLEGPIIISELAEYESGIIPALNVLPNMLPGRIVDNIVRTICSKIDRRDGDQLVIESNTANVSYWAEIIAQKLEAKHFMFLLDEYHMIDEGLKEFIRFKFDRSEIAVIHTNALRNLLGYRIDQEAAMRYVLSASYTSAVEDVTDSKFETIDYGKYDYVICSLGRLNKTYIPTVIDGFEAFANSHKDKKICYIFIGDQPQDFHPDMKKVITDRFGQLRNVELLLMGYVYPVPASFFRSIHVGVASSGSSRVLWKNRVKTISMDAMDGDPIGILGYTTKNTLYRDQEERAPLKTWMDRALSPEYLEAFPYCEYEIVDITPDKSLIKHMDFIAQSDQEKRYYDVRSLRLKGKRNRTKKVLYSVLGLKGYACLKKLLKK